MTTEAIECSIVIPVFNSANTLAELHERLSDAMRPSGISHEIIMVDDSSTDDSPRIIADLKQRNTSVKIILLESNIGQHRTLLRGFREAVGKYIITIDDDLQYPPEAIPEMLATMKSHPDIDVVIGVPDKCWQGFYRYLRGFSFRFVNAFFLGRMPKVTISSFKVMKREVAEQLVEQAHGTFGTIGTGLLKLKSAIVNKTVDYHPRRHGRSGYNVKKTIRLAGELGLFYIYMLFIRLRGR